MRIATVRLKHKKTDKEIIMNAEDYQRRLGEYAKEYSIVGNTRGEEDTPLEVTDSTAAVDTADDAVDDPDPSTGNDDANTDEAVDANSGDEPATDDVKLYDSTDHHATLKKAARDHFDGEIKDKDHALEILRGVGLVRESGE